MFKNHPRGLALLFFTEMWERFGFYTMMAVFTLYMDKDFSWNDAHKADVYGLFLGAVYFFPILGGFIADRFLGYKNTIKIGAVIMAIGYAMLTLSSLSRLHLFYSSLAFIAIGNGLFKANISVMVGNLYEPGSKLKDAGFNIFYMGINIGAFLSPLAATILYNIFNNYNVSFGAASIGMLLAIVIFQLGMKNFQSSITVQSSKKDTSYQDTQNMSRKEEIQRLVSLGILFLIVIFFWICFYQNGFALTLFAERSTVQYSFLRAETYQFFNPFFIILLTPLLVSFFTYLRRKGKEPSSAAKIFLGIIIAGLSVIIMVFASLEGGNQDAKTMSPVWLISSYFVFTIAEILVSPMGLSYVSKVAPPRMRGLMMGCWFGATAVGAYASGLFGRYYSTLAHHEYFIILTVALFCSSFLILIFLKNLNRFAEDK